MISGTPIECNEDLCIVKDILQPPNSTRRREMRTKEKIFTHVCENLKIFPARLNQIGQHEGVSENILVNW